MIGLFILYQGRFLKSIMNLLINMKGLGLVCGLAGLCRCRYMGLRESFIKVSGPGMSQVLFIGALILRGKCVKGYGKILYVLLCFILFVELFNDYFI